MSHKEAELLTLKETLTTITQSRDNNPADYEKMTEEHNNAINEKDTKITGLEIRLANAATSTCSGLHRITSDESCFRLKPKQTSKNAKATEGDDLKCDKKDVDTK